MTKTTRSMALVAVLALAAPGVCFAENSREHTPPYQTAAPDDGKSFWQRLIPKFSADGRAKVDGELTPEANWQNSSEQAGSTPPKPPVKTATEPAGTAPAKEPATHATAKASHKKPARTTEAWWWENVGNPPVDALSNCLDAYAAEAVKRNADVEAADVVREALAGACRPKYDDMVKVLSNGLTKARYDEALAELERYTFVPTVTSTLDRVRPVAAPTPRVEPATVTAKAAPAENEVPDVEARKQVMFDCFNREADALALQNPAAAPLLAREVVARCDEATRGFFAALFVAYPVDRKAHEASISIAVQQNYMPAIAHRIAIVRQGQPAASGDSGSDATDSRARTTVVTEQ